MPWLSLLDPRPWLAWLWQVLTAWLRPQPADQIEPGLWQGPYPDKGLPPGVTAVLNVGESQEPAAVIGALAPDRYVWLPVHDGAFPGIPWLARCVFFLAYQRGEGSSVLVHCKEGVSRSGLVVVAWLMREHGWDADRALDFAQAARPQCQPNPYFLQGLREWQKYINRAA